METQFEPVRHKGDVTGSQNQMLGKAGELEAWGETLREASTPQNPLLAFSLCWSRLPASFSHANPLYSWNLARGLLQGSLCRELSAEKKDLSFLGLKFSNPREGC